LWLSGWSLVTPDGARIFGMVRFRPAMPLDPRDYEERNQWLEMATLCFWVFICAGLRGGGSDLSHGAGFWAMIS